MKKLIIKDIPKRTLDLCKEVALNEKYETAPLKIYKDIRMAFTANKTIDELALKYPLELV